MSANPGRTGPLWDPHHKTGRPIARVTPATSADNRDLIGCMKAKIQIKGDLFSTGVKWDASLE